MRCHVLGLGSVGTLLAYHLRATLPKGDTINLIHRTARQSVRHQRDHAGYVTIESGGSPLRIQGFKPEVFSVAPSQIKTRQYKKDTGTLEDMETTFRQRKKMLLESIALEDPITTNDRIEILFVTMKAHRTLSAMSRLAPRLTKESTVVLLQNGMGVYEELVQKLFINPEYRPHFVLGINSHGTWQKDFMHTVHAGQGTIEFGIIPDPAGRDFEASMYDENLPKYDRLPNLNDISPFHPSSTSILLNDPDFKRYRTLREAVSTLLSMDSLHASWRPIAEVQTLARRKLVVNAVINPLTSLMNCQNGDILRHTVTKRIVKRVISEATQAFAAQMIAQDSELQPSGSASSVQAAISRLPKQLLPLELEAEVMRIAEATSNNVSSMLADIRRGNSTEIDYINGYLLSLGRQYNVQMPATAMLANLVRLRSSIPLDQTWYQ
jgi:2-dehydropantoate 2-reductase